MYPIDVPGVTWTLATGIDGGRIVGGYKDASGCHGFLYNLGTNAWTYPLDAPGSTYTLPFGIQGDTIVGHYDAGGVERAFLYDAGTNTWTCSLNVPGAKWTYAYRIDGDTIVGHYDDSSGVRHGFLYDVAANVWTYPLDYPGETHTSILGIEGKNVVGHTGYYTDPYKGFLYDGTTWTSLVAPGATSTFPYCIKGGKIVGAYRDSSGNDHGFLYRRSPDCTLDEGLVAYYPFEGNANDASGNGNHGTEQGGPTYVGGVCGEAISLDGLDDCVMVPKENAPQRGPYGTVAGWVKIGSTFQCPSEGVGFISKMLHSTGMYQYEIGIYAGTSGPGHACVGSGLCVCETCCACVYWRDAQNVDPRLLFDDKWHHLSITWTPTVLTLYVDGMFENSVLHGRDLSVPDPMEWDLNVGRRAYASPDNWKYLKGYVDEVRIYDRALAACEIRALACAAGNAAPTAEAGDDQTVYADADFTADVTLDGSGSSDPDGDEVTYTWTWTVNGETYQAEGVNPTIELPVGEHTIELVVKGVSP